jgi:hypothetical protein
METPVSTDLGAGTRLLLRLWRGMREPGYAAAQEEDWEALLAACDYHQVSPIVFHRLQEHGDDLVPAQVLEQLRARFYRVSAYNHRLAILLVQLIARFEQQRIPCLALKGPAVALAAYGDLSLRQYEDIDILVHVEDVSQAVEMLFSVGLNPAGGHAERHLDVKLFHEITLIAADKSYSVDLHWQLAPPYARVFGPDPSVLWRRAVKLQLPAGDVKVLSHEDMFLALCQHGTRHRWWQLKWLFDVAEMLRNAAILDWSRIEDAMEMYPMARPPASLGALLARELLGVPVPPEIDKILQPGKRTQAVARAIRDEFLSRGWTNRSSHDTLLGLEQRPLVRVKYMANEAFQYRVREVLFTITEKDLEFVQLPERLRLLYYLIRPLRLMVQHGWTAARRIWSMAR